MIPPTTSSGPSHSQLDTAHSQLSSAAYPTVPMPLWQNYQQNRPFVPVGSSRPFVPYGFPGQSGTMMWDTNFWNPQSQSVHGHPYHYPGLSINSSGVTTSTPRLLENSIGNLPQQLGNL